MATATELLTQLQNLIDSILADEAAINSVNTTAHRSMLQKNIDAILAHINDAEAHGAGGLPTAQVGSLLAYLGTAWGSIAPGAAGQGLLIEFQTPDYIPVWKDLIPHINLAYENNGYCYTGVNDAGVGYVSGNNVRVYIPQLSKYVYLAVADSKTFQLNIPVNTIGGKTHAYAVIAKADLLAAANGANVTLSIVDDIAATHIVLLETMAGTDTSAARTSGLLQSLANEYRVLNLRFEEVTINAGVASLDVSKYDKTEGRFYVATGADVEINTPGTFLLAKGEILVKNTGASPITVTFNQSFYYSQITLEAGGKRLYKYCRETSVSSRLNVYEVWSNKASDARPYDLHFALADESSDLTTDENDGQIQVTRAQTIVSITFYVNTAPTGSAIVVAIKKNTTTIATLTLPAGSTSVTITTGISDTALAIDDRVHADITQIGATVPGAGAKVGINTNLS